MVQALQSRLIGARDLIIDSAPILAWKRHDPDAAFGTLLLPILVPLCGVFEYTPSSVVVPVYLSSFCFHLPTHTMLLLLNDC